MEFKLNAGLSGPLAKFEQPQDTFADADHSDRCDSEGAVFRQLSAGETKAPCIHAIRAMQNTIRRVAPPNIGIHHHTAAADQEVCELGSFALIDNLLGEFMIMGEAGLPASPLLEEEVVFRVHGAALDYAHNGAVENLGK
jgi:hypothetical protein